MQKIEIKTRSTEIGKMRQVRARLNMPNSKYDEITKSIITDVTTAETPTGGSNTTGLKLLSGDIKGRVTTLNDRVIGQVIDKLTPLINSYEKLSKYDDQMVKLSNSVRSHSSEFADVLSSLKPVIESLISELLFLLDINMANVVIDKHMITNLAQVFDMLGAQKDKNGGRADATTQAFEKLGFIKSNEKDTGLTFDYDKAVATGTGNTPSSNFDDIDIYGLAAGGGSTGGGLDSLFGNSGGGSTGGGLDSLFGNTGGGSGTLDGIFGNSGGGSTGSGLDSLFGNTGGGSTGGGLESLFGNSGGGSTGGGLDSLFGNSGGGNGLDSLFGNSGGGNGLEGLFGNSGGGSTGGGLDSLFGGDTGTGSGDPLAIFL